MRFNVSSSTIVALYMNGVVDCCACARRTQRTTSSPSDSAVHARSAKVKELLLGSTPCESINSYMDSTSRYRRTLSHTSMAIVYMLSVTLVTFRPYLAMIHCVRDHWHAVARTRSSNSSAVGARGGPFVALSKRPPPSPNAPMVAVAVAVAVVAEAETVSSGRSVSSPSTRAEDG